MSSLARVSLIAAAVTLVSTTSGANPGRSLLLEDVIDPTSVFFTLIREDAVRSRCTQAPGPRQHAGLLEAGATECVIKNFPRRVCDIPQQTIIAIYMAINNHSNKGRSDRTLVDYSGRIKNFSFDFIRLLSAYKDCGFNIIYLYDQREDAIKRCANDGGLFLPLLFARFDEQIIPGSSNPYASECIKQMKKIEADYDRICINSISYEPLSIDDTTKLICMMGGRFVDANDSHNYSAIDRQFSEPQRGKAFITAVEPRRLHYRSEQVRALAEKLAALRTILRGGF